MGYKNCKIHDDVYAEIIRLKGIYEAETGKDLSFSKILRIIILKQPVSMDSLIDEWRKFKNMRKREKAIVAANTE